MLTSPTPHRDVQLGSYRRAVFREGCSEQLGAAFIGEGIGAAVLSEGATEISAPDSLPIVIIMACSTRRRQNFDLLDRRRTSLFMAETLVVIPQGHASWWASSEPMCNLHVHVEPAYIHKMELPGSVAETPQYGLKNQVASRIGRLIERSLTAHDASPILVEHLLVALLAALFVDGTPSGHAAKGGLSPWALRRCIDHLESRVAENVSISELAAIADLSPFHFVRMFQKSTGHPPFRYLQMLRTDRAKALLSETDLSIADIAMAVGYDSPSAFARIFRARTGVTPSRWRNAL